MTTPESPKNSEEKKSYKRQISFDQTHRQERRRKKKEKNVSLTMPGSSTNVKKFNSLSPTTNKKTQSRKLIQSQAASIRVVENDVELLAFNQLMDKLFDQYCDTEYLSEFLATYRTICTPDFFIKELLERFKNSSTEQGFPTQFRCIVALQIWLQDFWYDFERDEAVLSKILLDFFTDTPGEGPIKSLIQRIMLKLKQQKNKLIIPSEPIIDSTLYPNPIYPTNDGSPNLFDFDSTEVARQMTIIEFGLWKKIRPWEFIGCSWNKPNKEELAPNISKYISWFNSISSLIKTQILSQKKLRRRIKILKKFLEICERLIELKNFSSAMQILSGINSGPVSRLKKTWQGLSSKQKSTLEEIKTLLCLNHNYRNLRKAIEVSNPPMIPYIGVFLNDITFIEEGNPDNQEEGLLNMTKRRLLRYTLTDIQSLQSERYYFHTVHEIKYWLENSPRIENEDDHFDISRYLEPKEGIQTDQEQPAVLTEFFEKLEGAIKGEESKERKSILKTLNLNLVSSDSEDYLTSPVASPSKRKEERKFLIGSRSGQKMFTYIEVYSMIENIYANMKNDSENLITNTNYCIDKHKNEALERLAKAANLTTSIPPCLDELPEKHTLVTKNISLPSLPQCPK